MNMDTGKSEMVISLEKMSRIIYAPPRTLPSSGYLYFFREGWNPSGTRFIAFIKDPLNQGMNDAYTMAPDGSDVRFFYHGPSHHSWQDDKHLLDFGGHQPPDDGPARKGYFLFEDNGTGKAKELLWPVEVKDGYGGDGHDSYLPCPGGDWIISDTYPIDHYQYLFLFHRPTKRFVPACSQAGRWSACSSHSATRRCSRHSRLHFGGRRSEEDVYRNATRESRKRHTPWIY